VDAWAFIFCLAALIVFLVATFVKVQRFSLVALGLALFVAGYILTYVASGAGIVHF